MKNGIKPTQKISAIALCAIFSASASAAIPDGWRVPTANETTYDIPIREEDPNRYLLTEADFNGDGRVDVARILINDKKDKMALFVFLSGKATSTAILLTQMDDKSWVRRMGVEKLEPGKYQTACGRGYGTGCPEDSPATIVLERPAIKYFQLESASYIFVWDEVSKSFKKVWMTD